MPEGLRRIRLHAKTAWDRGLGSMKAKLFAVLPLLAMLALCAAPKPGSTDSTSSPMQWLRRAAAQDLAGVEFYIGLLHDQGFGFTKDYGRAMHYYLMASTHGLPDAEYYVGLHYEYGAGVNKDPDQAMEWYRKAAAQDYQDAKTRIAALQAEPTKPPSRTDTLLQNQAPNAAAPDARPRPIVATHTVPPYPVLSETLGEQGKSAIQLHLTTSGNADGCAVVSSSGSAVLDRAACDYVHRIGGGNRRWRRESRRRPSCRSLSSGI